MRLPGILLLTFLGLGGLSAQSPLSDTVPTGPDWRREIMLGFGFSRTGQGFGESDTDLGLAAGFRLIRQWQRLSVGAGPTAEVLSIHAGERLVSFTGLMEYAPGRRRLRPYLRVESGLGLPVGSRNRSLEARKLAPIVHPSVGLRLHPPQGSWGALSAGLGYRFVHTAYDVPQAWTGPRHREMTYRRLTLTLSTQF